MVDERQQVLRKSLQLTGLLMLVRELGSRAAGFQKTIKIS
jgi:hypothetical protein